MPTKKKPKKASARKPTKKKTAATKKTAKRAAPAKSKAKKAAAKKSKTKAATKKPATTKKAPTTKAATKKAATKKAATKKAATKPAAKKKPAKPRVRRDATGHLDQSYERDLRRLGRENAERDDDRGFLVGERREDALADELGKEFVETVTSGEDEGVELRDKEVAEEVGGPFVTTTSGQEFADEPDESNPEGATREPFPKT